MPAALTIAVGDTVEFQLGGSHNAVEISEETYNSEGTTPLSGGFMVGFGETAQVTFDQAGTHYYVCTPHATFGMFGTITVE